MPPVFLYRFGPLLLLLHAVSAIAACGASVHQGVIAVLALRGRFRLRLARVYGVVVFCTYLGTLLFGGLLYPRYRYFVRGLYLDRYVPWAANLFDLKENLATLGLPLCLGALVLGWDLDGHRQDPEGRHALLLYVVVSLGAAAVCLFDLVSGLLCTSVRGI